MHELSIHSDEGHDADKDDFVNRAHFMRNFVCVEHQLY